MTQEELPLTFARDVATDACPTRERESLLTAACACGPKEGDA